MAALTMRQRDVERWLNDNPVGATTEELSEIFECSWYSMKRVLCFLRRHKLIKREEKGVWRHVNWLNKK